MLEDLSYINARDLLESTDIKNIFESGGEINFSCPSDAHFHGDNSPSARMNSRTTAWLCHGCSARGNAITFLAWHRSIPETEARRLLEERYGGGRISTSAGNLLEEVEKIQNPVEIKKEEIRTPPSESWLQSFKVDWNKDVGNHIVYMFNRGFEPEILENWDIGYDQYSNRVTIPIRDHLGKLIGFKGRAIDDGPYPKYMILGDKYKNLYGFDPYQKSKYIYGLDHVYRRADRKCIVVEGELNVLAMEQHGYVAVAIAGSEFSEMQAGLLKRYLNEITLYLDNDKSGDKGTKKVIEMLSPYIPIKVVQNAPGDAADLDTKTVIELIESAESSLVLQAAGRI